MKNNGQGYLFCKGSLSIKVLVKALEAVEAGRKSPTFKYLVIVYMDIINNRLNQPSGQLGDKNKKGTERGILNKNKSYTRSKQKR